MKTHVTTRYGAALVIAGALALAAGAVPEAQRRNRGDNSIHGMPVATNTIARSPERYFGKLVTVSAAVDSILSKTVFVVDQRQPSGAGEVKAGGTPLLVIAPHLAGALEQGRYFMVRGEVVKFRADAAPAGYTLDVPPQTLAAYEGQPMLLATSIINGKYAELVRPPGAP